MEQIRHSIGDKYMDAQESTNSNVGDHHNIPKQFTNMLEIPPDKSRFTLKFES